MFGLAAVALAGCAGKKNENDEFAGLGRTFANSDPPPGVYVPIADGDVGSLQERGVLLHAMERALALGYEQGAYRVGVAEGDIILPLVDIDPGNRSAQVLFLRWPRDAVGPTGTLHPKWAERWLLVSMTLEPERVLDRELLAGKVVEDSAEYHRAFAMLAAAEALESRAKGEMFHLFTVAEITPTKKKRITHKIATRVYALSAEGDGPDLEVLVDEPKRNRPPEVLETRAVHGAGAGSADPIVVAARQPAAATVARAMLRGPSAGDVDVQCDGSRWQVAARTGRVSPVL